LQFWATGQKRLGNTVLEYIWGDRNVSMCV